MIPTKRIWAARPLLIAYVVAVGFTVGLLLNRTPSGGRAVPALAGQALDDPGGIEHEIKEPPLWLQVFRPSQATARQLLRMGMPFLAVADGSALESERPHLVVYWTGRGAEKPQTLFQAMLPFLKSEPPAVVERPQPLPLPPDGNPQGDTVVEPPPGPQGQQGSQSQRPSAGTDNRAVVNNGLPLVGIYHTHDWESYVSEFPAGTVKTESDMDKISSEDHSKKTVINLGDTMAKSLLKQGITTVHSTARHHVLGQDYAYTSSRETAKKILTEYPSTKILLDIHRDGVWNMKTQAVVDGQKVAQARCIIGNDEPHWQQNLAFCERLMARMEKMYPGTTLPTKPQGYTYNQDLLPGAILVEIGNVLDQYQEAERTATLLAKALAAQIREGDYPK